MVNEQVSQAAEESNEVREFDEAALMKELESIHKEIRSFREEVRSRGRTQFGYVFLALGLATSGLSFNYEGLNQLGLLILGILLISWGTSHFVWDLYKSKR